MKKDKTDTLTIDKLIEFSWSQRYTSYDEALSQAEKALTFSNQIAYVRGIAYSKLNIAVCHFLKSNNEEAFPMLKEALSYFEKNTGEKGYVNTLLHIGNIYESYGDYEQALDYCQKALRSASENQYTEGLGDVYSVLGTIYTRLADYDSAQKSYMESLEIRKKIGNKQAIASSLNRLAQSYCLKKDYDSALIYYSRSREIREKMEKYSGISWTYLGMASTFEYMGNYDDANKYYSEGANHKEVDIRCKAQCLMGSGRINRKLGNLETAGIELHEAELIAVELNAKPLQFEIYKELAKLYEKKDDFIGSLEFYKKFYTIKEEVLDSDTSNRLKNQQIVFAIEKSEKEKEIYHLRNVELKAAYNEINEKNEEITSSIQYALRIQSAMLPKRDRVTELFPENFVLFLPRDIVSGDFYWLASVAGKIIVVVADCTGHGVPGAFMSMLGMSFLNEIVNKRKTVNPSKILWRLRKMIVKALRQKDADIDSQDGMDAAVLVIDRIESILEYSGAYNPLVMVRDGEMETIPADRMPVGISGKMNNEFTSHRMKINIGDKFYIYSDGFQDQFGGTDSKKLKSGTFKKMLLETSYLNMADQRSVLEENFYKWKGPNEQVDDIIVFGIEC